MLYWGRSCRVRVAWVVQTGGTLTRGYAASCKNECTLIYCCWWSAIRPFTTIARWLITIVKKLFSAGISFITNACTPYLFNFPFLSDNPCKGVTNAPPKEKTFLVSWSCWILGQNLSCVAFHIDISSTQTPCAGSSHLLYLVHRNCGTIAQIKLFWARGKDLHSTCPLPAWGTWFFTIVDTHDLLTG